jgi:hypothetical protein
LSLIVSEIAEETTEQFSKVGLSFTGIQLKNVFATKRQGLLDSHLINYCFLRSKIVAGIRDVQQAGLKKCGVCRIGCAQIRP